MSYFEHYYNLRGQKTLRRYSRPIDLSRYDGRGWMTGEEELFWLGQRLATLKHRDILEPRQVARLRTVDRRLFHAGRLGSAH